jgi:hypothetical protein
VFLSKAFSRGRIAIISVKAQPFSVVLRIECICTDGDKAFEMSGNQVWIKLAVNQGVAAIFQLQGIQVEAGNKGGSIRHHKIAFQICLRLVFCPHHKGIVQDGSKGECRHRI